jgi:RNA polymerase sigma-70 factor (ECF subfamily)
MDTLKTKRQDLSGRTDEDLTALARDGNSAAFGAIMQRYNRRLFRIARGIVGTEAEAEDVLQEAYVRAYAALRTFRGDAGLCTWLTRIVMNEALGRLRQRRPTEDLRELDRAASCEDTHVIMFPRVAARRGSRTRGSARGGATPPGTSGR